MLQFYFSPVTSLIATGIKVARGIIYDEYLNLSVFQCRLLLKNGADINAQTTYGDTPVHLAAYRGHYKVVKTLVEAGCDLDIRNSKGRTALDDATMARRDRVARYLTAVMYPGAYPCVIRDRLS